MIITKTFNAIFKNDTVNEAKDGSTLCFFIPKLIEATIFLTNQKPTSQIATAANNFVPKSAIICPKVLIKESIVIFIIVPLVCIENVTKKIISMQVKTPKRAFLWFS
jgi:hypothetical protein